METTLPTIAKYDLEDLIRRITLATEIEFTLGEESDPFHPEINAQYTDKRYFEYTSIKGDMLAKSIGKALSEPTLVVLLGEGKIVKLHIQFIEEACGRKEHSNWKTLLTAAEGNPDVFKETANIGYLVAIHAALMKASRVRLINHSLGIRGYLKDTETLIRKKYDILYFHHHGKIKGYWRKLKGALNGINRSIGPF